MKKKRKRLSNIEKPIEEKKEKRYDEDNYQADALDGMSVDRWEEVNGRGFWGNSLSGYIYDKDLRD